MEDSFKSGFCAVLGRPNAGKSTLLNALLGEKISIISSKPQTTRNNITGILNEDGVQVIFIDTPGIHAPKTKLGQYMEKSISTAQKDVDLSLFLVSAKPHSPINPKDAELITSLPNLIIIINKIDMWNKTEILNEIDKYSAIAPNAEIFPVSALKGDNVEELKQLIISKMPVGPQYYPDDIATTQTERQMAAETLREKALVLLRDEIPHGIAVEISKFTKRVTKSGSPIYDIDATLFCEKDSHKGMIIGKNGAMLKKIGENARPDIQRLLDCNVYLTLWVKVKKDWRDNDFLVKDFGYNSKDL